MRFFTDENVATSVVAALRRHGHDVKDIKEEKLQGTSDKEIIRRAYNEERIIITHDRDFGNVLSFSIRHHGVILLRFKNQRPEIVAKVLLDFLGSDIKHKLQNNVTIISEERITVHRADLALDGPNLGGGAYDERRN